MTALKDKFITMQLTDVLGQTWNCEGFGPSSSEILKFTYNCSFVHNNNYCGFDTLAPTLRLLVYQVAHGMGTYSGLYGTKFCQTGQQYTSESPY